MVKVKRVRTRRFTYRFGDRGQHIEDFQDNLIELGYALPKWGADGVLGGETFRAAEEFEEDNDLTVSCEPSLRMATVRRAFVNTMSVVEMATVTPIVNITERTGRFRRGTRKWANITGVTLHQTGIMMTNSPKRFETLRAHIGIIRRSPRIVIVNPFTAYMSHGNGLNRTDVGLEVNGLFAGISGKRNTIPHREKKEDTLPDGLIVAIQEALFMVKQVVESHRGKLLYLNAHRQSNATRRADPGSAIWSAVAPWARETLGLNTRLNKTWGNGRPIPKEWDERATARY